MKIVVKTYLLIGILISLAAFNLFLLYQQEQSTSSQSYSIIRAGDVKVKAESISSLATSVANGNLEDKDELQKEIDEIQSILTVIKNGGVIKGQTLEKIPAPLSSEYNKVSSTWESYKSEAMQVEETSVFDQEATSAMNYVLQKNQELVLYTDALAKSLQNLDRNYNTHKQIAEDLAEGAKIIGQQSLLISIGEGDDVQEILKQERLKFEIGIRKLLQISTAELDVESVGAIHEELISIPRENSESLRKLDPLWESVQIKIKTIGGKRIGGIFDILTESLHYMKNSMNEPNCDLSQINNKIKQLLSDPQ